MYLVVLFCTLLLFSALYLFKYVQPAKDQELALPSPKAQSYVLSLALQHAARSQAGGER